MTKDQEACEHDWLPWHSATARWAYVDEEKGWVAQVLLRMCRRCHLVQVSSRDEQAKRVHESSEKDSR